jgi:ABC-type dipeptide/oligopeptide/nickel transport system permease subunit|tara:strand:- start:2069 stop:3835 length:1767 start_codon:yes stop_codon:yes gene_type:complete
MRGWDEGEGDRDESRRRLREALSQSKSDLIRSWKIYRRSLLAMLGLFMVISVSLVAIFAETIAVEHPYRNLQDTEDKWLIDYEPRRADPRSEECDWHEQKITTNPNSPLFSEIVVAESDDKVGETIANGYYRDTLTVIQLIKLEDPLGYDLNLSLLSIDPSNSSLLVLSPELYGNTSLYGGVWVTYEFDNEEMHHWWLPDGYDVCIFGTNDQGHDLFSKVVYGAQVSLKIGITVATLTVIIGTIVGSISGYFGGRVDEVIMRICDIFFAIPGLILAMAFVAAMNQITSLTIPIWLGILFPIFVLAAFSNTYLNSTVPDDDQISEQAMRLLMRYRGVLLALVGLLFFIGWIPGASWPDFFGISEGRSWRIFAALGIIAVLGAIILADRRFFLNTSFEGGLGRIRDSFDWTNPWRYLTFRTLAVFVSLSLLFSFSGNEGEEIVLIKNFDRLWKVQAALIFTGWPGYARLIRGQVLYVKEMTFVEAARSVGARPGRIMFRHILPNAWAPLLVAFTLDIGGTILSASGLSFLGLGADAYTAEWGLMISESRRYFLLSPHLMLFPGLAIAVTVLGFNLLGDGIRDIVDPKNRR